MSRQWVIDQINKLRCVDNIPKKDLLKDGFLLQREYELLRTEYYKHKLRNEEWH